MTLRAAVDRFEGEVAVILIGEEDAMLNVPCTSLPEMLDRGTCCGSTSPSIGRRPRSAGGRSGGGSRSSRGVAGRVGLELGGLNRRSTSRTW